MYALIVEGIKGSSLLEDAKVHKALRPKRGTRAGRKALCAFAPKNPFNKFESG